MPRPFVLPDLGEGLQEAEIVKVLVTEGDVIAEDSPLLEVETDKAQVEIPSPFGGRVERIHVRAGQAVRVGEVLVTFADVTAGSVGGAARREGPVTGTRSPAETAPPIPQWGPSAVSAGERVPAPPSRRTAASAASTDAAA